MTDQNQPLEGEQQADPYTQPQVPQSGPSADPYGQPGQQQPGGYGQPGQQQPGGYGQPGQQQPGGFGQQPGYGAAPSPYAGQMNPAYNGPPAEAAANTLTLNYWLSVFFSWIPALIFFLTEKDKHALMDDHLKENMNFQITRVIAGAVTIVPVIGWLVGGIASIVLFVFAIIAALKAPDEFRAGRSYRFPFAIRVIK